MAGGGVFLGLATLVLQIILTVGAPALLVAALLGESGRARLTACLRIVAGGAAVLAATVLYFLAVGHLDEFVEGFVMINAEYTKAAPPLTGVVGDWGRVVRGYGTSTVILVGGLLALPVLAVAAHRRSDPAAPLLTGMSVATLTGVAWMVHDFDSWPDAFPVLPLAALGAGGTLAALGRRLGGRRGIALVVAWSLAATGLALAFSLGERDHVLEVQRRSVDAMLAEIPDASIVSIQAPQPLVLSGRRNPTRHQMFANGLAAVRRRHLAGRDARVPAVAPRRAPGPGGHRHAGEPTMATGDAARLCPRRPRTGLDLAGPTLPRPGGLQRLRDAHRAARSWPPDR